MMTYLLDSIMVIFMLLIVSKLGYEFYFNYLKTIKNDINIGEVFMGYEVNERYKIHQSFLEK